MATKMNSACQTVRFFINNQHVTKRVRGINFCNLFYLKMQNLKKVAQCKIL